MNNPFEPLVDLLTKIDQKLDRLNLKTKEEPEKNYTVEEVAIKLRLTPQSIRKKIHLGIIKANTNTKPFLIPHSSIYDENNRLINFKYLR
ncbi:MAG: hypothetical protein ACRC8Z_03590 [Empedobacter falsenii]|uniref:hypothetical protein n=1 Tax=Empedobacter TaxID=59734 RepID=UPI0025C0697F|nr:MULTISPECIES: hypothetical protein [unclassified Empedobacter]